MEAKQTNQRANWDRPPRLAELKVSYRHRKRGGPETRPLKNPAEVVEYLRRIWDRDTLELREEFIMLVLDGAHQVRGWVKLSAGATDSAPVDRKLAFGVALQAGASAVIFAHNHPSGSLDISREDRRTTHQLCAAGEVLGVRVLDHIIITASGHVSLSEGEMMPKAGKA